MIYDDQDIIWWLKDLIVITDRNLTSFMTTDTDRDVNLNCEKNIVEN